MDKYQSVLRECADYMAGSQTDEYLAALRKRWVNMDEEEKQIYASAVNTYVSMGLRCNRISSHTQVEYARRLISTLCAIEPTMTSFLNLNLYPFHPALAVSEKTAEIYFKVKQKQSENNQLTLDSLEKNSLLFCYQHDEKTAAGETYINPLLGAMLGEKHSLSVTRRAILIAESMEADLGMFDFSTLNGWLLGKLLRKLIPDIKMIPQLIRAFLDVVPSITDCYQYANATNASGDRWDLALKYGLYALSNMPYIKNNNTIAVRLISEILRRHEIQSTMGLYMNLDCVETERWNSFFHLLAPFICRTFDIKPEREPLTKSIISELTSFADSSQSLHNLIIFYGPYVSLKLPSDLSPLSVADITDTDLSILISSCLFSNDKHLLAEIWKRLTTMSQLRRQAIYDESLNMFSSCKHSGVSQVHSFSKLLLTGMLKRVVAKNNGSKLIEVVRRIPFEGCKILVEWLIGNSRKLWKIVLNVLMAEEEPGIICDMFVVAAAELIGSPNDLLCGPGAMKELGLFLSLLCTSVRKLDLSCLYMSLANSMGATGVSTTMGDIILSNMQMDLMYSNDVHPSDEFNRKVQLFIKDGYRGVIKDSTDTENMELSSPQFEDFLLRWPEWTYDLILSSACDGSAQDLITVVEFIIFAMAQSKRLTTQEMCENVSNLLKRGISKNSNESYAVLLKLFSPFLRAIYVSDKAKWETMKTELNIGKLGKMGLEELHLLFILSEYTHFDEDGELFIQALQRINSNDRESVKALSVELVGQLILPVVYSGTSTQSYHLGCMLGHLYLSGVNQMLKGPVFARFIMNCVLYSYVSLYYGFKQCGTNEGTFLLGLLDVLQTNGEQAELLIVSIVTLTLNFMTVGVTQRKLIVQTLYMGDRLRQYFYYSPISCSKFAAIADSLLTGENLRKGLKQLNQGAPGKVLLERVKPSIDEAATKEYKYHGDLCVADMALLRAFRITGGFPCSELECALSALRQKKAPELEEYMAELESSESTDEEEEERVEETSEIGGSDA